MKIPSNKIADIVRFFRNELNGLYEKEEIETFIAYCFDAFIGLKRVDIFINGTSTISESELLKFNFAIKDLKQYKPIQYILGKADFYGLKFIVNPDVLIPRPETEELVDLIIKENTGKKNEEKEGRVKNGRRGMENEKANRILDIGTGSGCIAIALKKHLDSFSVCALDVSEQALNIAKKNAVLNKTDIEFFQHDILSANPLPLPIDALFDIIVSNPPYIGISEKSLMSNNVVDYEPHLALFVEDTDPLLFYKAIADFAKKHLNKNGKIYFEINQAYGLDTKEMLMNTGFHNVMLLKDLNSNYRILYGHL
ncbi:MAG: peptide chain release factor N(5)-glutamine methyltransferase [Bacteroidota bacterium]